MGKIRIIVREIASQIALRNCSEEVSGEVCDFGEGGYVCAINHTFWQKVTASHKKVAASHKRQMSLLMIFLVLF